MITVTAAEFRRHFGRYQDVALTQPVAITNEGRERVVMISADEYRRLKRQKTYQAIFKNKPGTPPFLYKAQGKTLPEALEKATNLFIGVARRAAAAKKAAEEAVAEAAEAEIKAAVEQEAPSDRNE